MLILQRFKHDDFSTKSTNEPIAVPHLKESILNKNRIFMLYSKLPNIVI